MDEKILGKAHVIVYSPDLEIVYDSSIYVLCFTQSRLIGFFSCFLKSWFKRRALGMAHVKESDETKKIIDSLNDDIERIISYNKGNFSIEYEDIEEVRFGFIPFKIKLNEKYDNKKIWCWFDINNKSYIIELFQKFSPEKTIVKFRY